MKHKLEKGKIYRITWLDIQIDTAWQDLNKYKKPEDKICIWYYVAKQDEYEVFSSGGDSDQHFDVIHIPLGCITKIEPVDNFLK